MHGLEVKLPGGLFTNGSLERHARFRPLTGRIEQAFFEQECCHDRSSYVTGILSAVLDSIGSQPADAGCVANLCIADRQFLMLRLAAMLDGEQMWLKVGCAHCDVLFDVDIRRCDLPVKEAGKDFPLVTVHVKEWEIVLRVPTGEDQVGIGGKSEEEAMGELLQSCICSVNGEVPTKEFISKLSDADVELMDEALDEISPALCNRLLVICPECKREQHAELDHYALPGIGKHFFFNEVHILACHYHWSEAAILDLPLERRRLYLNLISRSSGMVE